MQRYAVVRDLDDAELRPIALVTEHDDAVRVHFAVECGLRSEYREPYVVQEPDGEAVRYEPGRPEYFNSVISTLSRGFLVGEPENVAALDPDVLTELYVTLVALPRAHRQVAYVGEGVIVRASGIPIAATYAAAPVYTVEERPPELATVGDDSLLCRAA